MRQASALFAFNRGLISQLALARTDQRRIALGARTMTNWIARVLGSMSLRPGLGYLGATGANAAARYIPFIFGTNDTALVEFTTNAMRIWIGDALLTRSSVSSAVTNGSFDTNITGWTDGSDAGGAIAWYAGGYMALTSNGSARAIGHQTVTVAAADQNVEHGLRVVIQNGPVTFKVGTALGDDSYISETTLDTGTHSLAFTPTGNFVIQFQSTVIRRILIDSVTVEAAGVVSITSPYGTSDLNNIRFDQSADVVYLACSGVQQRKIERRGTRPGGRSWSLALYRSDDGPFKIENVSATTIASSGLTGNVTLTASSQLFQSGHVGSLFRLQSQGQAQTVSIAAENTFGSSITVTGTGTARAMGLVITGLTGSGSTVTLQQSTDNATWTDYKSYTTDQSTSVNDGLDNQTVYYRLGIKTGDYGAGTQVCSLTFTAGVQLGIVRITDFTSATSVEAEVITALGSVSATAIWWACQWSDVNGWPTAVRFHDGRLWWAGQNTIIGSVSDEYVSFDDQVTGDSGPIIRTIGAGPVDTINWLLSLQRMVMGAQGSEISVRSSALDAPLTPTDFSMKECSTQGSGPVESIKVDQQGIYVDRTKVRVFRLQFDTSNYLSPDYASSDLTVINPEIGLPAITRAAVQRRPDTRIHFLRSDGTVALLILEPVEDVICWIEIETNGTVEDVVILPGAVGSTEDQVYYQVARTVNGSTVRYLEKWAKETECRGTYSDTATLNKQADSFVTGTNSPASTTISGLDHLEGLQVCVWADGVDYSPGSGSDQTLYTVASGAITLATAVTNYVVGLPYKAQWKSAKLGLQPSDAESLLGEHSRITELRLIAGWLHAKGLRYGTDFTTMRSLPRVEGGKTVDADTVHEEYDGEGFTFPARWLTDDVLCLEAHAPRPCTVLAAVPEMEIA